MTFDMYNILDSLEDFGLKYSSAPSLHDKMVQLSLDFNLNEDDLGNTIVAFALNSKKRILDIDLLSLLESELNKGKNKALKERDPDYNITSVKSKPEVESMAHLDNIIGTENRIPLSGSYANFTPVQEASSDISYIQRKNKGDAILTRRGNKFIPGNNSGKATIHGVSTGCDGSVGNDKAAAIIEIKSERLSEFASFFYLSNSEVTNWTTKISPSTDLCCIYGEVIREKNDVFHDGLIHLQLNDENGTVLPVDIKNLKNITIFPGQVIGLTGSIPTGNIFEAKEQLTLKIPRSSSISNAEIEHLKLWVAAGPFTSSHSFSYEPLYDLLELVKQSEPHVLVLMGPFVDRRAKLLSDPAFNEDPEDILNTLLVNIGRELENCKTEVIMQPSPAHDTCSLGVFPAPPLVPEAYIQRHIKNKIHFVPDPAVVNIEGVTLALSGSEIIPHLSKVEYHVADDSAPQIDRITRLSNHILQQRIMYPLSPAAIPSSLLDTIKHAKLDTAPNILILPSVLPPSIKISSDTAICNPGCVLKGKSGMYLTIDINLDVCRKSACDFAESSLFEIVRL